jgi:hypothetical protein
MSSISNAPTDVRSRDGLGITSFSLGAISMLSFGLLSVYATAFDKTESANTLIGEFLALIWMTNILGIGFGIAGIVCQQSRKALPVLGLATNSGLMSLSLVLIAIGLHMH